MTMTRTEQMVNDQLRREDEVRERLRGAETPEAFERIASEMRDEEIRTASIQAEFNRTQEAEVIEKSIRLHREVMDTRREVEEARERMTSLLQRMKELDAMATMYSKSARAAEADKAEMLNKTSFEMYRHFDQ